MTETRQYIGFGDVETFLVKSYKCITGGREFDIDKYGPYVDAVKRVLVPSLEKQILFFLERFVYNEDLEQSSYEPYFSRYKESMLTAYAKYNEIGSSIEAMRDSITVDHLVDFIGQSLLTNSRLAKISNDLNAMGVERNWLGYVNVLNYINEKDFWVCPSSSSNTSRQYSSICYPSKDNILSDMDAEKGSHLMERTRGQKRPRKRAATHISRKHYKLERLALLSDGSFRVSESLYDLLKSSWDLHDTLQTKRRLKRNGVLRRSSFAGYHRNHRRTDWKNENLKFVIKKWLCHKTNDNENQRNSEVRTTLSLPCKVEQLLWKLERVDPSLTRSHCSFIKKKFRTKLYNVCSCLNNLLSRTDAKMIDSIYLACEIRRDYLNFRLKQTLPSRCKSSLFSTRVMTCEALYRYGIRKSGSRQKLQLQSSWAKKKANELSTGVCQSENIDYANDEAITSIEITFTGCEGSVVDPQNVAKGLTCDPENLEVLGIRDSLSISDVVQKLALSPFRLQETEQSFRIRSKIRDIVRSIMICRQEHLLPGREGGKSIAIQATVSTSSLSVIKDEAEPLPVKTKAFEVLSNSELMSFIESKIFPPRSREILDSEECIKLKKSLERKERGELTGSVDSEKSVIPKSCLEAKEQCSRTGGSVRPSKSLKKSQASSSSRESAKPKNKNKYEIRATYEKPVRSKEFTGSSRRPMSKKMVESIASEISHALAITKSNGDRTTEDDYEIDVTVEIEDSSHSSDNVTESVSRHTHILPSMKSVRLGTSSRYFPVDYAKSTSSSSLSLSESEVVMHDNFTTMNKSMIPSSNRSTTSSESYDRIKHLIREKVCGKLSGTDSCRANSSKTIVSSRKYYLSIPSSKTSHVHLKRETFESSSTSRDSLEFPACNCPQRTSKTSSSDDESICSKSSKCSDCYLSNSPQSSGAATCDKNSVYGCVEDRLANRYLRDIINDYSEEVGDSPRQRRVRSQISDEDVPCNDERQNRNRFYDSEVSTEENEAGYSQGFGTDDDPRTNISLRSEGIRPSRNSDAEEKFCTTYIVGRAIVEGTRKLHEYGRVEKAERTRRASGWSTCAIRTSSSRDCPEIYPPKYDFRLNTKGRGDSRQKTFAFSPLNIIEKYKKRFQNIDRKFRTKLLQYAGYCKNVKNNLQKQMCLDDIYEASMTSIPPSNSKRHKHNCGYFAG